jgi:hypothetical protein
VVALSEREQAILDFERSWWMRDGSKEAAVKEELGLSSARYYQLLGSLLSRDDALAYDPLLVRRLRRLRDRRRRARFEGPSATPGRQ